MTVESQLSYVVLSKLSAGSSYIISITTTKGRAQSDALTSLITTGTQLDACCYLQLLVLSKCVKSARDTPWIVS